MNTILKEIKKEYMKYRKEKVKEMISLYSTVIGEIEKVGKDNGNRETTEEETIQVIKKVIKSLNETINIIEDRGADSKEIEEYIIQVSELEKYLPKQLSEEELGKIINSLKEEGKNIGEIMKYLKENYSGRYDGKLASQIARK